MRQAASVRGDREFASAEQWVVHNIQRWILDGVLAAEVEISQQDIANRLGVSRSPVRDALRSLEALGFVSVNPNQRAVVTALTPDKMQEIFEMRAALEGLAALRGTPLLTESDLIELESLAHMMGRLKDLEAYITKHDAFHDLVAERSGMPRLRRELSHLRTLATPYIRIYANTRSTAELVGDRHEDLVEILAKGDGKLAAAAFTAHTYASFDQLSAVVSRFLKQSPDNSGGNSLFIPTKRGSQ